MPHEDGASLDRPATRESLKPTSERKTIQHFEERIKAAADFCRKQWEVAERNFEFVGGEAGQWSEKTVNARKEKGLPTFTLNDVALAVNGMSGQEATNRFTTTFLGRDSQDQQDADWANVLRELDRWACERANAGDIESDKFRDLLITRYAWLEWRMDFLEDFRGVPKVRGIHLWDMMWDPAAELPGLVDREWDAYGAWVSVDEFLSLFPDRRDVLDKARQPDGWVDPKGQETTRWPWLYRTKGKHVHRGRRAIFLANYQWRERSPLWVSRELEDGTQGSEFRKFESEEAWAAFSSAFEEQHGRAPVAVGPEDGLHQWTYHQAWIAGKDVLREERIPYGMWTRQCMVSFPVKKQNQTEFQTLVDLMKDGQKLKNSVYSIGVSHLLRANLGGVLYEEDFFENENDAMAQWTEPMPFIKVKRGQLSGNNRWSELAQRAYPAGLDRWLEIADEMSWKPTGMNPATFGFLQDPRRVSGRVFSSLSEAPQVVLAQLIGAMKTYRRESGKLRLRMYAHHYQPEDLLRIVGVSKAEAIPGIELDQEGREALWRESFDRDVIVEEQPTSKSEQMQVWEYFSRSDLWGQLLQGDRVPMEIFVKMIPVLSESDRRLWLDYVSKGNVEKALMLIQQLPPEELQAFLGALQQMLAGAPAGEAAA